MRMSTPHLPLPPPLPYSPDSQPFLRHLQILSLALLSSDADESWGIYQALHPDLRSAVPDDVFVSLFGTQLKGSGNRLPQLVELVSLANSCGMDPVKFGTGTLESALVYMLKYLQAGSPLPEAVSLPDALTTIDWLWDGLIRVVGDHRVGDLPIDLRRRIVRLGIYRYEQDLSTMAPVRRLLEYVVDNGGSDGMRRTAERTILAYTGRDPEEHKAALRLSAWCLARDIKLSPSCIRTVLDRLLASYARVDEDALARTSAAVEELVAELRRGRADDPALVLSEALEVILRKQRSPLKKATDTAEEPGVTMPKLHRAGQRILAQPHVGQEELEAAVQLCIRSLPLQHAENEALLRITVGRLAEPPLNPALILQFTTAIVDSSLMNNIPGPLLHRIFNLITSIVHKDQRAYGLAQKIYPSARATSPPYRWTRATTPLWRGLLEAAMRKQHLALASRLYTDFVADGQPVFRQSALDFIRAAAGAPSKSRWILLDRHIKDYLWYHPTMTNDLVVAIAEGLGSTGAQDADIAVQLCRRIQKKLPAAAITALVGPLASGLPKLRAVALGLLAEVHPGPEYTDAYNDALSAFATNVKHVGLDPILRVYHDMIDKGHNPTAATASPLIRALLDTDRLPQALRVFEAAVKNKYAVRSVDVGRLMVHLALQGRAAEAQDVERSWRALFPEGPVYSHGVYGASLVVDIISGRQPDLSLFASDAEGRQLLEQGIAYRPNKPFFRFLERLQREYGGTGNATTEAVAEAEGRENLAEASTASLGPLPSSSKARVLPMTSSWSTEMGGEGGWRLDRRGESEEEEEEEEEEAIHHHHHTSIVGS
ncbi:uncharacterized protein LOC62_01G001487 [Vanrija pseudolonga]|uniref:Pentacotripeptide-repeat region of PRORP domain-containing protein n=1 Tax=Vanrija pseudolonga TaxID=143232 RepID=A0AAF0Y6Y4_9TREE|nr:hypothetical protein LOC62_01G001487 [Vanrija pseudolonga]